MARKFPYKFPLVRVFRRSTAGDRAAWIIAYDCPRRKKQVCRAVSPDVGATAAEARRVSEMLSKINTGQVDLRQINTEERERKPLLGSWVDGAYVNGHLDDYANWLRGRNRAPKYVRECFRTCRKMIRLCKWQTIADVEGSILETNVAEFVRENRELSLRQCNRYLKAPRQLTSWMAKPKVGRSRFDPLSDIDLYNEATDRRRQRRPLEHAELITLITAVRKAGKILKMSGDDRVMLYQLKFYTGFRNGEAASLTPESFHLSDRYPSVVVEAAFSKHRRQDIQPLDPAFARELQRWLVAKAPGEPVFAMPDKPNAMWRRDLETAGIPYRTHAGIADLYSLRHMFGTLLGQSGASIKTVQELMRHSDIRQTQKYMHSTRHDQDAALASLPQLSAEAQRASLGASLNSKIDGNPRPDAAAAG